MTKEALYPSQINTKTISCRISALDYVNFLQDALSKGITLNDWLLMKIYSKNDNKSNLIGKEPIDKEQSSENVLELPFDIEFDNSFYTFNDLSDIEDFIINSQNKEEELLGIIANLKKDNKFLYDNLTINCDLNKKEDRSVIWAKFKDVIEKIEWENIQDKKQIKRDLNELFADLFD